MNFYDIFIAPFEYEFMRRGLWSVLLLSVSAGILGNILILRRLALLSDALSHSLLPGIAIAAAIFGTGVATLFAGAVLAGVLTVIGAVILNRLTSLKEDAAFGAMFVISLGAGIAIISALGTRIDLVHFLFGNILGVSPSDVGFVGVTALVTVVGFVVFYRPILLETFDPVFYRAIGGHGAATHLGVLGLIVLNLVAALQTMGVVLALGLFILPALSASLWCQRLRGMILVSVLLAVGGALSGILVSYHWGISSGASVILCLGAVFLASTLATPRNGLVLQFWKWVRRGKVHHHAGHGDGDAGEHQGHSH